MEIYLAGPLFTVAERQFNLEFAAALRSLIPKCNLYLPQIEAAEMQSRPDFAVAMYRRCLEKVEACDIVVAILEGPDADSGTCVELGYARARGKRIIGVRTDLRASEDRGLNLMVSNVCDALVLAPGAQDCAALASDVAARLNAS